MIDTQFNDRSPWLQVCV